MLDRQKTESEYDDQRVRLARRAHDISSAWILAAVLCAVIVLVSGAVAPRHEPMGGPPPDAGSVVASVPLAEQIGMSIERAP